MSSFSISPSPSPTAVKSAPLRIAECVVEHPLTLGDRPAAEVVEAIIRTAAVDDVGRGPELIPVGAVHHLVLDVLEGDDLVGWQRLQLRLKPGGLLIAVAPLSTLASSIKRQKVGSSMRPPHGTGGGRQWPNRMRPDRLRFGTGGEPSAVR